MTDSVDLGEIRAIEDFEEFTYKGGLITVDLGSAWYDQKRERIFIEGKWKKDVNDITLVLEPEDTPEFNVSISSSSIDDKRSYLSKKDLEKKAKLHDVVEV